MSTTSRITPCPDCGCEEGEALGGGMRFGQAFGRRRCGHCGRVYVPEGQWPSGETALAPLKPLLAERMAETKSAPVSGDEPVIYQPVRCPKCGSKRTLVKSSKPPVRYHKCADCGENFKSVEQE